MTIKIRPGKYPRTSVIELDGEPVRNVMSVKFEHRAGEVPRLHLEIFATVVSIDAEGEVTETVVKPR